MAGRKYRSACPRRPRRSCCDDPGRADRLRWRHEAREFIAALEPEIEDQRKLQLLLASLAEFLEPGRAGRLGAEGVWGVFRAFREIAEEGAPRSATAFAVLFETPATGREQSERAEESDHAAS